jgi:hypothetical protein
MLDGFELVQAKAPCTRSLVLDRSRCFPPLPLAENPRPSPLAASKPRSVQATMAPRTVRTAALLLAAALVLAACFCCCCSGAGGCEGDGRFHAFSLVGRALPTTGTPASADDDGTAFRAVLAALPSAAVATGCASLHSASTRFRPLLRGAARLPRVPLRRGGGHHRVLRQENAPRRRLVRLLPPGVRRCRRRRQRGGRLQALRRRHARPGAGRPCQGPGRTHGTIAL